MSNAFWIDFKSSEPEDRSISNLRRVIKAAATVSKREKGEI
jgi:hypothetical protein